MGVYIFKKFVALLLILCAFVGAGGSPLSKGTEGSSDGKNFFEKLYEKFG